MYEKILLTLFGATVGWFLSWHRYRVAENANLISDHIKDVERFASELLAHWTKSFQGGDANEHRREIAKIRSLHASISSFYGEAELRLGINRYRDYQVLQLRLFKCGMGGNFESIGRDHCEETAIETQRLSWELIQSLRIARREQYSLLGWMKSYFAKTPQQ